MKLLKYIINENDIPVLFSRDILHNEVTQSAKSAGFLVIRYDSVQSRFTARCFGESTTLNVACNSKNDKKIIEDFFNH
jgi:ureidoglycolate hydrolase